MSITFEQAFNDAKLISQGTPNSFVGIFNGGTNPDQYIQFAGAMVVKTNVDYAALPDTDAVVTSNNEIKMKKDVTDTDDEIVGWVYGSFFSTSKTGAGAGIGALFMSHNEYKRRKEQNNWETVE